MLGNIKGSVQSTIVVTVSVITLLALAWFITDYVKTQISRRAIDKRLTQEIAEEGMQFALKKISENPSWTDGFSNVECNSGHYNVRIDRTDDSTFKAVATGFIGSVKTTLVCTYRLVQDNGGPKPKTLSWEYM